MEGGEYMVKKLLFKLMASKDQRTKQEAAVWVVFILLLALIVGPNGELSRKSMKANDTVHYMRMQKNDCMISNLWDSQPRNVNPCIISWLQ